jgi:hypothetical protein
MSTDNNHSNNTVDNAVNEPHDEEVDYADPESPTLAIRQQASPATGDTIRLTDDADVAGKNKQPPDWDQLSWLSGHGPEEPVLSPTQPPIKRRKLDLGGLMVKTTSSAKPISDKPAEQFRTVKRPEITRLTDADPMPPPPASKSLGRGSGKAGRPRVSDLAQSRANEAQLRQQLTEERQKHDAFRQEEQRRTAKLIEEKEQQYLLQVQEIRGLSTSEHESNPPQGLLNNPEPVLQFYDARSSDSSDPPSTPEQRTRLKRPKPDDDDLRSLGSYNKPTKPISKKDRKIEELRLQHQFEIKSLRAEMERVKAEQRRMKDDANSVRTLSTHSKPSGFGDDFTSAERVARRYIPAATFYGLPPRHTSLHPDPMTISELRTPTPADTTEPDESRRNSSAGFDNPLNTMTSAHFPNNSASVTTVLAYPSKSDAPIITTWQLTDYRGL